MSVFHSTISAALVVLVVILLLGGAVFGATASESDWLNPYTSQAEAEKLRAETRHQEAMDRIEEELANARKDAEIAKLRREQQLEQQRYEAEKAYIEQHYALKMESERRWTETGIIAVLVLAVAIATVLIIRAIGTTLVQVRQASVAAARHPEGGPTPAELAATRRQMREIARENERLARALQLQATKTAPEHSTYPPISRYPWAE